jgi:hypothetical protein
VAPPRPRRPAGPTRPHWPCPAGEDVIGPYLADRKRWRDDIVLPLIHLKEPVYVTSGTPAEQAAKRKKAKHLCYIDFQPDVSTAANFRLGILHRFDHTRAAGAAVRIEFSFPVAACPRRRPDTRSALAQARSEDLRGPEATRAGSLRGWAVPFRLKIASIQELSSGLQGGFERGWAHTACGGQVSYEVMKSGNLAASGNGASSARTPM